MATKTAPAKKPAAKKAAPRKTAATARKAASPAAEAPAAPPVKKPRRSALPLPLPALPAMPPVPSPVEVVKTVVQVIEDSPVGKAGAVTSAVLRSRRAAQLSRRVRNKIVVVTGATSGIGQDCALKLAAAGATVILAARTPSKLDETVERIRADGGKAFAYACDIADMAACDRFIQQVLDDHRHVDILINNAGRSIRRSVKASFDRFHDFERTMQLNYFGALKLIFGFAPKMLERKSGHIINISSIGVLANSPRFSAYVASKAALDAFSRCAQGELSGKGISFTTVNMPLVKTPMIAPTKMYDSVPTLSPEEAADLLVKAIIEKPSRIATRLGIFAALVNAVAPKAYEVVMNTAFELFPDSAAAKGDRKALKDESPSQEQIAFAALMRGVHW